MAKEKLLPVLILLLFYSFTTKAEEVFEFKKEDIELARELVAKSREISMSAIKAEWLKLQKMQQGKKDGNDQAGLEFTDKMAEFGPELKIFVSNSMGKELLKNYLKQAKLYKATLIFNGLPNGSWHKLSELVYEITDGDEEGVAMQIDDLAFAEYGITSVPSFVLATQNGVFGAEADDESLASFDKVVGNIGVRRALEEMVEKGELSIQAAKILAGAQSK